MKIQLAPSFFLCILLLLVPQYLGYFFCTFLFVVLHEFAHIYFARKYGARPAKLIMHLFGVNAELISLNCMPDKKKFVVLLAGPALNILCGGFFLLLGGCLRFGIFFTVSKINFFIALFNLLPIYPLDGGRLAILIAKSTILKKYPAAINFVLRLNKISVYMLFFMGLFQAILYWPNMSLIFISIYIRYINKIYLMYFVYDLYS